MTKSTTEKMDTVTADTHKPVELCFITPLNGVNKVVTTNFTISQMFGIYIERVNALIGLAKELPAKNITHGDFEYMDDGTDCIIMTREFFLTIPFLRGEHVKQAFLDSFDEVESALLFLNELNENEASAQQELDNLLTKYLSGMQLEEMICLHDDGLISATSLLSELYMAVNDGCLFIADRCPLVNYPVIQKLKSAVNDIPYFFTETRLSTMIRLYPSKLNDDDLIAITDTNF